MIDLPDDWVAILVVSITALAGVIAAGLTFWAAWLKLRADSRSLALQLDKEIDDRIARELKSAWTRIDALEQEQKTHTAQMSAVARILRAIARQWPDEHGPDLDPADITLIEDTIPASWMRPKEKKL